ncbi:Uncharacterized protein Adt_40605 [Abeliophyllum distichum]|uniref:Uncharacterized protein n=1 Tax=Abeliophyllum distichum TaxID=126358 RepID=A0ABD1Q9E0_9LAMI
MKVTQNNSEKFFWDPIRSPSGAPISMAGSQGKSLPKLMVWLIMFISANCVVYTLKLLSSSTSCDEDIFLLAAIAFPFTNHQATRGAAIEEPQRGETGGREVRLT